MTVFVRVRGGPSDGLTFSLEGRGTVGRSPACTVPIDDPKVAWEHVVLREERGGRLVLENLSAAGVRIRGRPVRGEEKLGDREEIVLSDETSLVVTRSRRRLGIPPELLLLGALAGLGVVLAGALVVREAPAPERTIDEHHWRQAYARLDRSLERWNEEGRFPTEALKLYRSAWRVDQALNPAEAARRWDLMLRALLSIPARLEGVPEGRTFAQLAGPTPASLELLMGFDRRSASAELSALRHEVLADALVWFVRIRGAIARERAPEEETGL